MVRLSKIAIVLVAFGCGDDGGGSTDASPTGDGSPGGDATLADGAPSDGTRPDGGAPGAVGPACGGDTCTNTTEDCCIGQAEVCKPAGTCPSQGFACDGPEDCATGRCCYGNGGTGGSECSTSTNCDVACHGDTNCPASAPKCCPKTFSPAGYGVCQSQC